MKKPLKNDDQDNMAVILDKLKRIRQKQKPISEEEIREMINEGRKK